ncbi:MAG: MBL fold metallo-hydrolase [Bacteroidota bacterium]
MQKPTFFHWTGLFMLALLVSCQSEQEGIPLDGNVPEDPYVVVLGIAQDAGFPQAGCEKDCCKPHWGREEGYKSPVSLGLVDPSSGRKWLIEATPDMKHQLKILASKTDYPFNHQPDGVFLTHAHIGHYTGLIHFGHEVMGTKGLPVYAMPRMDTFLRENGPWSQLVDFENIAIQRIKADSTIQLAPNLRITPFLVPHRDEYSETVGFRIEGPKKSLLFIPDIDKWDRWERDIVEEIRKVNLAFLDATFYENGEIPNRDMSEIPHPFVTESMETFSVLSSAERARVHFLHFNHTNPLCQYNSHAHTEVRGNGYNIAWEGQVIGL